MSKHIVESRDKGCGSLADRTFFEGGDEVSERCAMEFAKAMAEDGYHVTLSLEILVFDGKMAKRKCTSANKRGTNMHTQAKRLIGKSVQKVETTKRGIVASVENGWLSGSTMFIFADGYKGMYKDSDMRQVGPCYPTKAEALADTCDYAERAGWLAGVMS